MDIHVGSFLGNALVRGCADLVGHSVPRGGPSVATEGSFVLRSGDLDRRLLALFPGILIRLRNESNDETRGLEDA